MSRPEPELGDAFGVALLDALNGGASAIVIERDDGFVDTDGSDYFGDIEDDPLWRWIRPRLGDRVLDLGAGAGRGSMRLQSEGVDVTALDVSPGCIEVCSRRGARSTFLGTIEQLAENKPSAFDTVLALGNNLGLMGSPEQAKHFFGAARSLGGGDARIVGTMLDPHLTDDPDHSATTLETATAGASRAVFASGFDTKPWRRTGFLFCGRRKVNWLSSALRMVGKSSRPRPQASSTPPSFAPSNTTCCRTYCPSPR
ncbi:MAG: class I SAM-dependent methyltransferase [Actinobacteria bacterium]|nr:class I SAM-dependent methyltransferase [Actinomycetota bacterium]